MVRGGVLRGSGATSVSRRLGLSVRFCFWRRAPWGPLQEGSSERSEAGAAKRGARHGAGPPLGGATATSRLHLWGRHWTGPERCSPCTPHTENKAHSSHGFSYTTVASAIRWAQCLWLALCVCGAPVGLGAHRSPGPVDSTAPTIPLPPAMAETRGIASCPAHGSRCMTLCLRWMRVDRWSMVNGRPTA